MNHAARLRQRVQDGHTLFGAWAALASPFASELMSIPGVDYVCVDQQHGLIDYSDLLPMISAIEGRGAAPFSRVPANEAWMIGKALDAGVQGVIVPLVSTRHEAERAVQACRYPPHGVRSYGPIRSAVTMSTRAIEHLGGDVLCLVMVETRQGLDNLEEIASTPGLDGIYIGPADLALGLGLQPDLDKTDAEHVAAVAAILQACKRFNIIPGIQCGSGSSARRYAEMGFELVTFAKDTALLSKMTAAELAQATGQSTSTSSEGYT